MTRLILLIAILAIGLLLWYKIKIAKPAERKKLILWSVLAGLGGVLLILAIAGHLNIITAAIAGLFALAPRALQYAKYLPFLKKMMGDDSANAQGAGSQGAGQRQASSSQTMNQAQAFEVLGLQPGCTRDDIILAHKRMMQKMHPDRGGSDFMAAQINQAKDILLG